MGKVTGFMEYKRELPEKRPVAERLKDFNDVNMEFPQEKLVIQAARCMDCGIPFCNWACPLGNIIPDFNHLVYKDHWKKAYERLNLTNPFPEFTGKICPALCEGSCTLGYNRDAVAIEQVENFIIEKAFEEGWVIPKPPKVRTGKRVAVIGSGPAGLSAAYKLNSYGHTVTVFEKSEEPGGLLRFGIPDFKLEKWVVERRIAVMKQEGIVFKTNCEVGKDYSVKDLLKNFDTVLLTGGSSVPRDLKVEGRELKGIHFAMDYLTQQNRKNAGKVFEDNIDAKDKVVIVIGGGDTGSDCIGTARRQGAKEVYQYEILPKPPEKRDNSMPWPEFPRTLKTSSSHEEGCLREWCVSTKAVTGEDGRITSLKGIRVDWEKDPSGRFIMNEIKGSEFEQEVDLIFIAMGFTNPKFEGLLEELGVKLDARGNVAADENYMTSVDGVFTAGDMRTGQSLVVRAMADALQAAEKIDEYLMADSGLVASR